METICSHGAATILRGLRLHPCSQTNAQNSSGKTIAWRRYLGMQRISYVHLDGNFVECGVLGTGIKTVMITSARTFRQGFLGNYDTVTTH